MLLFGFLGGVPRLVVPDNLKSGINTPSFCDPEINRSYGMMANHYGVGVLPARPKKPRDKAKVENGVRAAQSYILGRLRMVGSPTLNDEPAWPSWEERQNVAGQPRAYRLIGFALDRRGLMKHQSSTACPGLPASIQQALCCLISNCLRWLVRVSTFVASVP